MTRKKWPLRPTHQVCPPSSTWSSGGNRFRFLHHKHSQCDTCQIGYGICPLWRHLFKKETVLLSLFGLIRIYLCKWHGLLLSHLKLGLKWAHTMLSAPPSVCPYDTHTFNISSGITTMLRPCLTTYFRSPKNIGLPRKVNWKLWFVHFPVLLLTWIWNKRDCSNIQWPLYRCSRYCNVELQGPSEIIKEVKRQCCDHDDHYGAHHTCSEL